MAILGSFTDGYISLAGTPYSSSCQSITLTADGAALDETCMGDSWEKQGIGRFKWSCQIKVLDDMSSSGIDGVLWAAFIARTTLALVVRPTSSIKGTNNPEFTGNVKVLNTGFGGSHGEEATKSVTLTGYGTLTRATS